MIHGVLTDTVVICHRVSPVSRRHLGGYSGYVIHGQDGARSAKMSLCMKQREKERRRRRKRERVRRAVNVLTLS